MDRRALGPTLEEQGRAAPAPPPPEAPPLAGFAALQRGALTTLQVNLGYRCNQACQHCHVGAGPQRREQMGAADVALIARVLAARGLSCLDLTGGAPELHPQFRSLVEDGRRLGVEVIDRCNLTILEEPGQEDLAAFLADQGVTVVASLPCYSEANVDRQRGRGVFARSMAGLRRLNALGYGHDGSGLKLHLVYNPGGAQLPPAQAGLELDYRRVLAAEQGVVFNRLYALANMPIGRFADELVSRGESEAYSRLLRQAHQPANLPLVMCRSLISVDWQGWLYDCDFNQMLDLPLAWPERQGPSPTTGATPHRWHLRDLLEVDPAAAPIRVGDHCFGCTAGGGSSCGGALAKAQEARPSNRQPM